MDRRQIDPSRMTDANRQQLATEVFHRLYSRVKERRWKKAAGDAWRLVCLWSA